MGQSLLIAALRRKFGHVCTGEQSINKSPLKSFEKRKWAGRYLRLENFVGDKVSATVLCLFGFVDVDHCG